MTVNEWQQRLENHFTAHGVVGGHLLGVFDREQACESHFASTFHGQCVLIDSFQSFFIETLNSCFQWVSVNGWPSGCPNFALALVCYATLFRRYRACEILLTKGYPLDGYALMRDLKDRAILLAGVAHNLTTLPRILGLEGNASCNREDFGRKGTECRKKEEQYVHKRMLGELSGLAPEVVQELRSWEPLFHYEVHGGRLSLAHELQNLQCGVLPSIGPTSTPDALAMYMNRSVEVGWLMERLLPYLQPVENAFGAQWSHKQALLDESFRYMARGLGALGKKIGDAFIALVDQKFSFSEPFYYREANSLNRPG
jgi:hypothetical protein